MAATVLSTARVHAVLPARMLQPTVRNPSRRYFGVSLGHRSVAEAECWLHALQLPRAVEACTHRALDPHPHVAVSFAVAAGTAMMLPATEPAMLGTAAARAAAAHATGTSGRAVQFRGAELLAGPMTAADALAHSAVERIAVLDHGFAAPAEVIDFDDCIRPRWIDGRLTLVTSRTAAGRLVPVDDASL